MKQAYRRWVCGLLACILALLAVCGAVVYVVDPCLYYRVPDKWQPVLFNERYQMAGLAKNVEADTVLVGTSMAANYRSQLDSGDLRHLRGAAHHPGRVLQRVRPSDERPLSDPGAGAGDLRPGCEHPDPG